MIVTVNFEYTSSFEGNITINLVDHWYEANYWESTSSTLGAKTGPYSYDKGHRKALLWDGAGTVLVELHDLDMPPYHINDGPVRGRAFYKVKNKLVSYGQHFWFHRVTNDA
jgi:hypothetical protein